MKLSCTDLRVAVRFFYVFEPNHHPTNPLLLTCENVNTYFRIMCLRLLVLYKFIEPEGQKQNLLTDLTM